MKKARLFLVRHGHCAKSGTYCGSTDAPLTKKGRRQALAAARALAKTPLSICYASPLIRAQKTARLICSARDIPIITNPLLRELHFGLWEGLSFAEVAGRWPDRSKRWLADPARIAIPKGEPFSSFRARVRRFLELIRKPSKQEIVRSHPKTPSPRRGEGWREGHSVEDLPSPCPLPQAGEGAPGNILIVAHGGVIAALLLEIYGKPASEFFKFAPALGSVREVEIEFSRHLGASQHRPGASQHRAGASQHRAVIPAKAGIHIWTPACAGVTRKDPGSRRQDAKGTAKAGAA